MKFRKYSIVFNFAFFHRSQDILTLPTWFCHRFSLIWRRLENSCCFFEVVLANFFDFFSLKCWFKGQIISRIHLSLPNAYILRCFDRNINGNRDVKFFVKWLIVCVTVCETDFSTYILLYAIDAYGQALFTYLIKSIRF